MYWHIVYIYVFYAKAILFILRRYVTYVIICCELYFPVFTIWVNSQRTCEVLQVTFWVFLATDEPESLPTTLFHVSEINIILIWIQHKTLWMAKLDDSVSAQYSQHWNGWWKKTALIKNQTAIPLSNFSCSADSVGLWRSQCSRQCAVTTKVTTTGRDT